MDRNGLNDNSFKIILEGLTGHELTKISYSNNEYGAKSVATIIEHFSKKLKEVRMVNLMVDHKIIKHQGLGFNGTKNLRRLSLSGMNLSGTEMFSRVESFLEDDTIELKTIELSWSNLLPPQISSVLELLIEN